VTYQFNKNKKRIFLSILFLVLRLSQGSMQADYVFYGVASSTTSFSSSSDTGGQPVFSFPGKLNPDENLHNIASAANHPTHVAQGLEIRQGEC